VVLLFTYEANTIKKCTSIGKNLWSKVGWIAVLRAIYSTRKLGYVKEECHLADVGKGYFVEERYVGVGLVSHFRYSSLAVINGCFSRKLEAGIV
jgi:hypothetical protein